MINNATTGYANVHNIHLWASYTHEVRQDWVWRDRAMLATSTNMGIDTHTQNNTERERERERGVKLISTYMSHSIHPRHIIFLYTGWA